MAGKIYTKRGDKGETGLLYGGRVPKNDPRTEAYGTVDEAVSALGVARSIVNDQKVRDILKRVQVELFTVGSELATDVKRYSTFKGHFLPVTPDMTARLEQWIDSLMVDVTLPRAFIIPGGSQASGALDLARAILRRAERHIVGLEQQGLLTNTEIVRYMNRLADLVFVLARYEDRFLPQELLTDEV